MAPAPPHFLSFLRRLYRRLLLLRLLESAGLGLLTASALSLPLLLILLYRHQPTLLPTLTLLALGATIGALGSLLRRPLLLDAAAEADRQLDLHDLLTTACTLLSSRATAGPDPFADAVLATADARCITLSPSAVLFNRFSSRTWTGIGLTTSLVLSLTLLSTDPTESHAAAPDALRPELATSSNLEPRSSNSDPSASPGLAPTRARTPIQDDPEEPERSPDSTPRLTDATTERGPRTSSQRTDGSSGGGAQSRSKSPTPLPLTATSSQSSTPDASPSPGVGASTPATSNNHLPSSSAAGVPQKPGRPAPAWASPSWPAARDHANHAVQSGQLPPEYQDLVRAYFDR